MSYELIIVDYKSIENNLTLDDVSSWSNENNYIYYTCSYYYDLIIYKFKNKPTVYVSNDKTSMYIYYNETYLYYKNNWLLKLQMLNFEQDQQTYTINLIIKKICKNNIELSTDYIYNYSIYIYNLEVYKLFKYLLMSFTINKFYLHSQFVVEINDIKKFNCMRLYKNTSLYIIADTK